MFPFLFPLFPGMASLTKKDTSPYWFACYALPDGRRTKRSTKQTDRRKAQAMAEQFEKAAKLAAQRRLGETQARRVLGDIYEGISGERLLSATARDYLTRWVEDCKARTSPRTQTAYAQVVRDFIASLGPRADFDISQISTADVAKYRGAVLARTSLASANKALKYLRIALGRAHKDGFAQDNPAAKLDIFKRPAADRQQRRAFTQDELRLIFEAASGDWKGMIVFGLYTGQRLRDLARLTWQNMDMTRKTLRFITAKTGRQMNIPLNAPELLDHIAGMNAPDDPAAPLFPSLYDMAAPSATDSRLSKQFHALLVSVGLAKQWEANGSGRHVKRTLNALSFHSLRHNATSALKNAGVAHSVAQDIIGHDSEAVSRNYTHIDEEAKRKAIAGLPYVFSAPPDAKQSTTKAANQAGRGR